MKTKDGNYDSTLLMRYNSCFSKLVLGCNSRFVSVLPCNGIKRCFNASVVSKGQSLYVFIQPFYSDNGDNLSFPGLTDKLIRF